MGVAPCSGGWGGAQQIGRMAERWRWGAVTTAREQRSWVTTGWHGSTGQGRPKGNGGLGTRPVWVGWCGPV
jgi:hypothetical protein